MNSRDEILDNLLQELKRGTLVLGVLLSINKPTYGYSLVGILKNSGIKIEQNTLYPLLRRLEKQGLLTSSWDTTESRPRKYYDISGFGKELTEELKKEWVLLDETITKLINKERENETGR